jgi:hypothetical protein
MDNTHHTITAQCGFNAPLTVARKHAISSGLLYTQGDGHRMDISTALSSRIPG